MSALIPVDFEDFLRMMWHNHAKYQLYYIEEEDHFKLYMFLLSDVIYFAKVMLKDILQFDDKDSPIGQTKIDTFKRAWLNDGIKVPAVFLPKLYKHDQEKEKKQTKPTEFNTNDMFNALKQDEEFNAQNEFTVDDYFTRQSKQIGSDLKNKSVYENKEGEE